jgi:hypothetical protein
MEKFILLKVGLVIGLIGLALSYFMGHERGKNEEIKQNEVEVIKSVEVASQVERDDSDLSRADLVKRLRDKNGSDL